MVYPELQTHKIMINIQLYFLFILFLPLLDAKTLKSCLNINLFAEHTQKAIQYHQLHINAVLHPDIGLNIL